MADNLVGVVEYMCIVCAICCLCRRTLLIKDVFHPASYTVDLSDTVRHAGKVHRLQEIRMQSRDSENVQRYLKIAQILRLRRTYL